MLRVRPKAASAASSTPIWNTSVAVGERKLQTAGYLKSTDVEAVDPRILNTSSRTGASAAWLCRPSPAWRRCPSPSHSLPPTTTLDPCLSACPPPNDTKRCRWRFGGRWQACLVGVLSLPPCIFCGAEFASVHLRCQR